MPRPVSTICRLTGAGTCHIVALGLLASACDRAPAPTAEPAVDRIAAAWRQPDPAPGFSVMVLKGDRVVFEKGYGLARIDGAVPITPSTRFLLASVTKQFTAWAVMLLADRGELSYDDPLSKFFPEFPRYADSITVRMILNHTGGFSEYEELFVEKGLVDHDWPRSSSSPPSPFEPTAREALALVAKEPRLRFQPGTRFEYSNTGYMLLAQIVEKVSGQRFAPFLEANVFRPLGMSASVLYDETRPAIPNRAASYTADSGGFREIDYTPFNTIYGEDNVVTTLGDMAKWARSLDQASLASPAAQALAWTPGRLQDGSATRYGFGWFFADVLGRSLVLHGGSWLGFRTAIVRFPAETLTVVVLANQGEIDAEVIAIQIGGEFGGGLVLPEERAVTPAVLQAVTGSYQLRPGLVATVSVAEGRAVFEEPHFGRIPLAFDSDSTAFAAGEGIRRFSFRRGAGGAFDTLAIHRLGSTFNAVRLVGQSAGER